MSKGKSNHIFLKISAQPNSREFVVSQFNGYKGLIEVEVTEFSRAFGIGFIAESELLIGDKRESIWVGRVEVKICDGTVEFSMLVCSKQSNSVISWSSVPKVFSVFDGGYQALSLDEGNRLVEELINFYQVVNGRIYFENSGATDHLKINLTEQDDVVELSDLLVTHEEAGATIPKDTTVVVEFELFEVSYFLVGVVLESTPNYTIFSLTAHIYRETKRSGRRLVPQNSTIGKYHVIEVNDFGMRVYTEELFSYKVGEVLSVPFPQNIDVGFRVVHIQTRPNGAEVGLALSDFSEDARTAWQHYLLGAQYPLLSYRDSSDHEETWSLLQKSGYLSIPFGPAVVAAKPEIMGEWRRIDSGGPAIGACVIGRDGDQIVSTISVARATENAWVAQTAAMLDRPEYLPLTRSIYAWRTRFILQQPDGEFHLAFFLRDKPFLDRFFRKFYLQQGGVNGQDLSWTEWKYYAQILSQESRDADKKKSSTSSSALLKEPFLKLIRESADGQSPKVFDDEHVTVVSGRPYLHICQYFTSIWLAPEFSPEEGSFVAPSFSSSERIYTIRTAKEDDSNQVAPFSKFGEVHSSGWEVVWICRRPLLSLFLSNSLRALEVMTRKYGPRSVA